MPQAIAQRSVSSAPEYSNPAEGIDHAKMFLPFHVGPPAIGLCGGAKRGKMRVNRLLTDLRALRQGRIELGHILG